MMKNYQFLKIVATRQKKVLLLLLQFVLAINCYGQQLDKKFSVPNYGDIGYLEYLPKDYYESDSLYPVIIFLHGAGERGNGTTDLIKVKKNGPPKYIEEGYTMQFNVNGKLESFIVISPQLRSDYNSWPPFYVDLVVEHVKKEYAIDQNRIYLTGLSMGGGACWGYVSNNSGYANKIAAMVPICGHQSFNASKVCNIANSNIAVWAHHGDADTSTPLRYSQDWVNGINNCSPGLAKLTIYPGVSHSGAWIRGYDVEPTYNDPTIYKWLLLQKKGEEVKWPDPSNDPINQLPSANAGADIEIELPTDQVQLNGTSSKDLDGNIVSYSWSQLTGPTVGQLTNQNTHTLTVSSLSEGVYTFKLQVQDDKGATDEDQVVVTVLADTAEPSPAPSPGAEDGDCECDHVITSSNPYVNGESLGVKPGDVICVQAGQYPYLNLFNFKGSASAPVTIKNCGGQVSIGNSSANYGIVMNNNHYFRLTGTGSLNHKYGFKIDGGSKYLASGFAIAGKSSDFEIDHLEISTVEAGALAKTNPSCDESTWNENYTMRNVKFHDFFIHDIKGEGFYIGHTSLNVTLSCEGTIRNVVPHDIENIEVYNNILQNTGWDGIQVSRANKDCQIYNNRIYNYGTENKSSQQAGIIVGGESTGKVFNNWVEKGTGSGVQIFGTGEVAVYNNVIKDSGEDAIFCDDRSPVSFSARLINNTIVNPGRDGFRLYNNEGDNNVINNNIVVAPGSLGNYGKPEESYLFVADGVNFTESSNLFSPEINEVNFKDPLNSDFSLADISSAIDAGTKADQFGILSDFIGTSRPVNGAYDIGAYESEASPSSSPSEPEKIDGLDYSYYEGAWSILPDFKELVPVKSGEVSNFDLSIRERNDNFAVMYSGLIDIPVTGSYTFEIASDDGSKLYIGGYDENFLVVDNDGAHSKRFKEGTIHLSAGEHPIVVTFFEKSGSEVLEVYWKNTAHGVASRQTIPDEYLLREVVDSVQVQEPDISDNVNGLDYSYYEGAWSILPDFKELVPVKSGEVSNFDLSIRERNDNFAVMYSGLIDIPVTGSYTFEIASDDGSKLYIGGYDENFLVVDNDGAHSKRFKEGTIHLSAGEHPIVVTFFEKSGSEILEVYWKNTAHGVANRQIIPDEYLMRESVDSIQVQEPDIVEVNKKFNINFTRHGFDSQLPTWNDIALDNAAGSISYGNITDIEGNTSDLSVTVYNGELGYTLLGIADNQSSLTNGIYPDAVLKHAAYTTGKAAIKIGNLDPSKLYNIEVYGGRAGSGERLTEYVVQGVTKTLQCMNNISVVQKFESLSPNSNREILVEFQQGGSTWAYMNALIIEEVSSTEVNRMHTERKGYVSDNELNIVEEKINYPNNIKVYPNPFKDYLKILVDSQNHSVAEVTVMDQWGKELHKSIIDISSSDSNELKVSMVDSSIKSGIYLVLVKLDENKPKVFRLIVQ